MDLCLRNQNVSGATYPVNIRALHNLPENAISDLGLKLGSSGSRTARELMTDEV